MRAASACAMARPTARTSVWRNESQTNTALIASESTVRTRSFTDGIGAPRVARRGGAGLLFVLLVALLRLRLGKWSRDAIRAGEPASQVGCPAACRAEGEGGVLLARLHLFAAAWTARHDRFCKMRPRRVQPARFRTAASQKIDQSAVAFYEGARMAPHRARERTVLVVDDDPDILQTLALCLSSEGYAVLMAANGQEALDLLNREKPACILLDLMMPVMDGWQFVSEIDQRGLRRAPLLILSADRAVQGHAAKLHADAYLAKRSEERRVGKECRS